ncbi:NAD(P)H-binding protein [Pseudarthrobacter sp. H3Y2-7]|uniref:SDR family oxidoreductase n=1 Tax=Pseudarthrobacter naphthalenicus TaxID=3031328 RepID=UPI0023B1B7BF|nr:NAD(P)H-binding protein [Pseudarthrobacter sp. H3Y2-7]MDE8668195.1 NAD(P)H-binding protein [Pseudarthrobacter sp. H3Y2-7]
MNIAVAGGTGTVGRHVVSIARARGHHVISLSRAAGVDLVSGDGLAQALNGVDAVIDVANTSTLNGKKSVEFFTTVTGNLLRQEKAAGVRHHVALSIVGTEKAAAGYYAGKLAQETLVSKSDVPWTILRATQFHEFAGQMLRRSSVGPLVLVPRMVTQPVAAREVAEALVEAAEAGPRGRIPDLGGPERKQLAELVRAVAQKEGRKRRVIEFTAPGPLWRSMRNGSLVPEAGAAVGRQTFSDWLKTDLNAP